MNYFKLIDKATGEVADLNTTVDGQICELLGRPIDEHHYCSILEDAEISWYDTIGLALACGKTFDDIRETWHDVDNVLRVVDFLEAHYTVDCGYSPM